LPVTEQSFHSAADPQVARFDSIYQQAVQQSTWTVVGVERRPRGNRERGQAGQGIFPFPYRSIGRRPIPLVTSAGGTGYSFGWTWKSDRSPAGFPSFLSTPGGREPRAGFGNEPFIGAANRRPVRRRTVFDTWLPVPAFPQSLVERPATRVYRISPGMRRFDGGGVWVYTSFSRDAPSGWHIVGGTSAASAASWLPLIGPSQTSLADASHKSARSVI